MYITVKTISAHIRNRKLNRHYSSRKLAAILDERVADELVAESYARYKAGLRNV